MIVTCEGSKARRYRPREVNMGAAFGVTDREEELSIKDAKDSCLVGRSTLPGRAAVFFKISDSPCRCYVIDK